MMPLHFTGVLMSKTDNSIQRSAQSIIRMYRITIQIILVIHPMNHTEGTGVSVITHRTVKKADAIPKITVITANIDRKIKA